MARERFESPGKVVSGGRVPLTSLSGIFSLVVIVMATAYSGLDPAFAEGDNTIIVSSADELVAALSPENAGRRILVRAGAYAIDQPLIVPAGAVLEGEGVMLFDEGGLPTGFAAGTRTTLTMTANILGGDVLTLRNGATVRGLEIVDLPGRQGNAIAVVSGGPGDRVSATITETEIVNPNSHALLPDGGPTGCGVAAFTANRGFDSDPPPDEGAAISALIVRSLIHAPGTAVGCGVFAFNFASFGSVALTLADNVIGGGIIANGGVSRPDAVHDAEVSVQSHRNLYRDDSPDPCSSRHLGWHLRGGSSVPRPIQLPETSRNALRMHSVDDRIEGFTTGITALSGGRFLPIHGPANDNSIDLELLGTTISTPSCGGASFVADLRLAAAGSIATGKGNSLRAVIRRVTGSGPRPNNLFGDLQAPSGALPAELSGNNRLVIVGSAEAFNQTNRGIEAPPAPELFSSNRQ